MSNALAHLLCPITLELPVDPVTAMDGHIYERKAIEKWLKHKQTSPVTNVAMDTNVLDAKHVVNVLEAFVELQVDDAKLHEWSAKRTIRRFLRKKAEWEIQESKLLFREIRTMMNPTRSRSASNMIRLLRQSSITRTVSEVYAAAEDAGVSEMRVSEDTMELVRSFAEMHAAHLFSEARAEAEAMGTLRPTPDDLRMALRIRANAARNGQALPDRSSFE